jgi:hypothetical protein
MKKQKVKVEQFDDVLIAWDRDINIPDPTQDGELLYLGTIIRINNQLIALEPFTDEQLDTLEEVVTDAIRFEREKRSKSDKKS